MESNDKLRIPCSEEKRAKIVATRLATKARRENQIYKMCELKVVENKLNSTQRKFLEELFVEAKWFYNHILEIKKIKHIPLNKINTTDIKEVKHFDKDGNEIISKIKYLTAQMKQRIVQIMVTNERMISTKISLGQIKHGSLNFKSEITSIPFNQYGNTHKIKTKTRIKLYGIPGNIKVSGMDQLNDVDEYGNAFLTNHAGDYYIYLVTFINKDKLPKLNSNGKELGLDFGIKTNITTSEGEKFDITVRESERLNRLQRKNSRQWNMAKKIAKLNGVKVKSTENRSERRKKIILMIRKEYKRRTNQKRELANKLISKFKKYDTVIFQDELIKKWYDSWFGKQVYDSCMGELKKKLKRLNNVVILDSSIPTTKFCPKCLKKNNVSLNDRTYDCSCGYKNNRDIHSAKNMVFIKNLVFKKFNFSVPAEHREITLAEFMASIGLDNDNNCQTNPPSQDDETRSKENVVKNISICSSSARPVVSIIPFIV